MTEFWTAAAVATVFAAITSAIVSMWSLTRNINQKSVIEERQKWRDTLRTLIPDLLSDDDRESQLKIRDSIVLRLNPYQDGEGIRLIDLFIAEPTRESAEAIVAQFQVLLKHDWERAKIEAGVWPWHARQRADRQVRKQTQLAGDRQWAPHAASHPVSPSRPAPRR